MSLSIKTTQPAFSEDTLTEGERIYARVAGVWKLQADLAEGELPDLWVITDDPLNATDAVIEPLVAPKIAHNAAIDAQILAKEQEAGGYNRGMREFMLGTVSIIKAMGGPDAAGTPGMVKVKQLDDAIKALRQQRLP